METDKIASYDKKKGIDFTGVTVVFFCHDGNGKLLLAKRSQNCRDEQGNWDVGAGSLEFGHNIVDTLHREIKEEYSTEALEHEFLGYRELHREANGNKTHWIGLDFKVKLDPTKVKIGEPHKIDAIGWFNKNNIPTPPHSQLLKALEKYKDRI